MPEFNQQLDQAVQLHQQGQLEPARQQYEQLLKVQPQHPDLLHLRGLISHQQGRFGEAVTWIKKALTVSPNAAVYHANLGEALRQSNQMMEAVKHLNQAVRLDPNLAAAYNSLGIISRNNGDLDQSVKLYSRALELNPNLADAHINLGLVYRDLGDHDTALKHCYRGLELAPKNASVHNNIANVLKDKGEIEKAIEYYRQALQLNPAFGQVYSNLAQSQRYTPETKDQVTEMERILETVPLSTDSQSHVHFAIAKAHDDLGEWDTAFPHFEKGNSLVPVRFNMDGFRSYIEQIRKTYTESFFSASTIRGSESDVPIFIVGMPRSGTSLTEQILASHPGVKGVGERKDIALMATRLSQQLQTKTPYPAAVTELTQPQAQQLSNKYLESIEQAAGKSHRIVDKMMTNYLHLGLIALLFPNAAVVHTRRHPLDVCLSCYFQDFSHRPAHTFDMTVIGQYYREYVQLMSYWRDTLPLTIFDVIYEELVSDPEFVSRQLAAHCGIEWDESCLQFHRTKRVVKTASSWQVRQPINNRSVQRWRNYHQHLQPLIDSLGDILDGDDLS